MVHIIVLRKVTLKWINVYRKKGLDINWYDCYKYVSLSFPMIIQQNLNFSQWTWVLYTYFDEYMKLYATFN